MNMSRWNPWPRFIKNVDECKKIFPSSHKMGDVVMANVMILGEIVGIQRHPLSSAYNSYCIKFEGEKASHWIDASEVICNATEIENQLKGK